METTSYAIALGSNRRHGRYGGPTGVLAASVDALEAAGLRILAKSRVRATPAMGGAGRSFANAVVLARGSQDPDALLACLKAIERRFGRRSGRRWSARVLDLDLLLALEPPPRPKRRSRALTLPHPGIAHRDFVLQPLADVAPGWRHPRTGRTVRQMRARLRRAKPVDRLRREP